jgi:hypothetical protein
MTWEDSDAGNITTRGMSTLNRVKAKVAWTFVHWPHMQNIMEQFPPSGGVFRNTDVFQETSKSHTCRAACFMIIYEREQFILTDCSFPCFTYVNVFAAACGAPVSGMRLG